MSKPICLKCKNLVWEGFHANCLHILIPNSTFNEAIELAEARLEHKPKKELAVIEQQQEIKFEKSLENQLMAIPYIVWRRKNVIHYYQDAPKTEEECPFRFEPF
jgi:hypothetical protein